MSAERIVKWRGFGRPPAQKANLVRPVASDGAVAGRWFANPVVHLKRPRSRRFSDAVRGILAEALDFPPEA